MSATVYRFYDFYGGLLYVGITGNPGRDPSEHRIRLLTISRKNGEPLWGTKPGETFK